MEENVGIQCGVSFCEGLYEELQASVQIDGQWSREKT